MFSQVSCTPAAAALISKLKDLHQSELLFHQSGGCCDGSAPMCYPRNDFPVATTDVLIGEIEGCPFYMAKQQYASSKESFLLVDVVPGQGNSFSIEAPEGLRFLTRSRAMTEAERRQLAENIN